MPDTAAGSALTDGTGVSAGTSKKLIKDLVADFLLTLSAALGAGAGLEALDIGTALQAPNAVGIAIAGAFIRVIYRAGLRWATT